MTRAEQNFALAKLCGISDEVIERRLDWELALSQMQNGEIRMDEFYRRHLRVDPVPEALPDYLSDLNAMHRAEETVLDLENYYCILASVVSGKKCYKVSEAHHEKVLVATAAQRAEAVLRYHDEYASREV